MNIRVTECKETYVASCTPAPPVFLPDCEDGWEIGNGTAVCSTATPEPADALATTGGDPSLSIVLLVLAVGAIAFGAHGIIWSQRRIEREEASKRAQQVRDSR